MTESNKVKFIHEGIMVVLSSPSGTGKTTITRKIIENHKDIKLSVSVTTRKRCATETNMKDYIFVSDEEFDQMVADGKFLEYAHIYGHKYGTLKDIQMSLLEGQDILFDIDWQGAKELKKLFPGHVISIFIIPPSIDTLRSRLMIRNRTEENINDRLMQYVDDIKHFDRYDYIVMNDDLDFCISQIMSIILAERQKVMRQRSLRQHLQNEIAKYSN